MSEGRGWTPGPWNWGHGLAGYDDDAWTLGPGVLIADETDGTPGGDETDQANARLIAAAPDLYEALAEMVAAFKPFTLKPMGAPGSEVRDEQDRQIAAHAAARAALSRALGAPPSSGECSP